MGYDMHWCQKAAGEDEAYADAQVEFQRLVKIRDALPKVEKGTYDMQAYDAARNRGEQADFDDHKFFTGRTERYIQAQDAVDTAYHEMLAARKSYFRFNMSGMGRAVDIMYEAGMVFDDDEYPEFPKIEDLGISWEDIEAVENPESENCADHRVNMTPGTVEKAEKYIAERERVLSFHGKTDTPGIPAHKFGSNDGWHVLPVECDAAMQLYMRWLGETGEEAARNFVENAFGGRGFAYWNEWVAWIGSAAKHGGFTVR